MPRILLLIILIWLLYTIIKRFIAKNKLNATTTEKTSASEKIVECSQCGLHIPESESHVVDSLIVCNNPQCDKQK